MSFRRRQRSAGAFYGTLCTLLGWEPELKHILVGAIRCTGEESFLLFDTKGSRYESYYTHQARQQQSRAAGVVAAYDVYPELNPTDPALVEAQIREMEDHGLGTKSIA